MTDSGILYDTVKYEKSSVSGVTSSVAPLQPLHGVACDEDVDAGVEGGERPLPPQLHLHVDEEVPRALDLPL